jgi:hypothetical protein
MKDTLLVSAEDFELCMIDLHCPLTVCLCMLNSLVVGLLTVPSGQNHPPNGHAEPVGFQQLSIQQEGMGRRRLGPHVMEHLI